MRISIVILLINNIIGVDNRHMRLLGIGLIFLIKILINKGLALGIILLLFWIKGRKLNYNSECWDNYLLQISDRKLSQITIGVYICSLVISSVICYMILYFFNYLYAMEITMIIVIIEVVVTGYRYKKNTKEYILKRYCEVRNTILNNKEEM